MYVYRETYHLEPASKYGLQGEFNSVIYRASDVVYTLEHKHCSSSSDSPRLRLVQVTTYSCMHACTNTYTMHVRLILAVDACTNTVCTYSYRHVVNNVTAGVCNA